MKLTNLKDLIFSGQWLAEHSGNFTLWCLQLLYFVASKFFEIIAVYLNKSFAVLFLCYSTVTIQSIMPVRPIFHINVLPAALVFMRLGYGFRYMLVHSRSVDYYLKSRLSVGIFGLIADFMVCSVVWVNIAQR